MILQILSEDPTKCTAVEAWLTEKYGRDQAYGILKAVMAGGLLVGCVTGAVVAGAATVGTGAAAVAAVCTAGGLGLTGLTVIDAVNAAHEERLKAISSALSADFVTDFNKLSALERDQLTQLILAPTAFIGGVAGVKGAVSLLSKLRPQVAAEIVGGLPATVRSEISAVAAAGSKELGPGGEIKVDWVVSLKNPSTEDVQNMAKAFKEAFGSDTAQFKGETIGHNPINTFYASDEAIVKVSPRIDAKDPTAGLNEVVTYERWGFEAEAGIEKMISSHVQNYQAQGFVAVDPKFKYFSYGSQVPVSNPLPDIVGKQVRGFQNVIMENRAVFFEGQVTRTFMDSNGHVFVEITGANENFTVQLSREFGAPDLWVKP